jgi:hypothetical protein
MTAIEHLDRPRVGWFALDVVRAGSGRKWDWCSTSIQTSTGQMEAAKRAKFGSVSPASIATLTLPGTRCKTCSTRGIEGRPRRRGLMGPLVRLPSRRKLEGAP